MQQPLLPSHNCSRLLRVRSCLQSRTASFKITHKVLKMSHRNRSLCCLIAAHLVAAFQPLHWHIRPSRVSTHRRGPTPRRLPGERPRPRTRPRASTRSRGRRKWTPVARWPLALPSLG